MNQMQKAIPQSKEGKPRTLVSQISMQDGINVQDGHFLKFAARLFGCLSKKDSNKGVQDGPFPKKKNKVCCTIIQETRVPEKDYKMRGIHFASW